MDELIVGLVFTLFAVLLFYFAVIKEALLRKRCTWEVEAEVLEQKRKKHVSHDDNGTSVSYTIESLCRYYYRGIYYEENVSFGERYFNFHVKDDKIRFKIDPNEPKTIYVDEGFYKIKTIFLTCFLGVFFLTGIGGLSSGVEYLLNKNKGEINIIDKTVDSGQIEDEIKKEDNNEKTKDNISNATDKASYKLDTTDTYLSNAKKENFLEVNMFLPKEMEIVNNVKNLVTYKNKVNKDAFSIKVVNHSTDEGTAMRQLQDLVWKKYSPAFEGELYRFNDNLWQIYTVIEKDENYKIAAISANDNKKILVVFKNGKGSNTDIRDVLGGIDY